MTKDETMKLVNPEASRGRPWTSAMIKEAMDIHAKEVAIGFYEFAQKESWGKYTGIDRWNKVSGRPEQPKTYDELYQLYLNHLQSIKQ